MTVPAVHVCRLPVYSLTNTDWPVLKVHARTLALWAAACCCCFSSACSLPSGKILSKLVWSRRPIRSWLGLTPVVVWGVIRYCRRNIDSPSLKSFPLSCLFTPCFTVCTARSANPLVAGWYGADNLCCIPFASRNSVNSWAVKLGPLSLATTFGTPWVAKTPLIVRTVIPAVIELVGVVSIHFECASTKISTFWPSTLV